MTEPAVAQVHSPGRLYLLTYLASALLLAVVSDVTGGSPRLEVDGFYGLIGLALGVQAWNERAALTKQLGEGDSKL